jgi:hypothetical protein
MLEMFTFPWNGLFNNGFHGQYYGQVVAAGL